jgi:hypothetical protein
MHSGVNKFGMVFVVVLWAAATLAADVDGEKCRANNDKAECRQDDDATETPWVSQSHLMQKKRTEVGKIFTPAEEGHSKAKKAKLKAGEQCDMIAGVPVYSCEAGAALLQARGIRSGDNRYLIEYPSSWSDDKLDEFCAFLNGLPGDSNCLNHGHPSEQGVAYVLVSATKGDLEQTLTEYPGADHVEHDHEIHLIPEIPSENAALLQQAPGDTWGIDRIDQVSLPLDAQYNRNHSSSAGAGTHVYILDTGVIATTKSLRGVALMIWM